MNGPFRLRPDEAPPAPDAASELDGARDVLRTEADALTLLAGALDGPLGTAFAGAVDRIASSAGRTVVSGIGKSGHVGRKIAATLASTGTPALFVHPAEASHGDLGMVLEGDVLLLISRSGETAELADLLSHATRFGIAVIALTGPAASTLARAADIVLALPDAPEACPMGLAPTTSAIMQMAFGDALAVALLRRRGFTATEFGLFHPGGRLGSRLRLVSSLMHEGDALPLAPAGLPLLDAVVLMTRKSFGCLGVIDDAGRLEGVLTDGDLRRAIDRDLKRLTVGAVMTRNPRTIAPDRLAAEALHAMNDGRRPVTALFAIDAERRPVGILHVHDLLRAGIA